MRSAVFRGALLGLLSGSLIAAAARLAMAQDGDPPTVGDAALQDLSPRLVSDEPCVIAPLFASADVSRAQSRAALTALAGEAPEGGAYHWVIALAPPDTGSSRPRDRRPRAGDAADDPAGARGDTLRPAPRSFVLRADGRAVQPEQLYEADRLVILAVARGDVGAGPARVRAATAVRSERGQLASGFPFFLGELLAAVLPRAQRDPGGCGVVTVWRHVTPVPFHDATLAARFEATTRSAVAVDDVREAFRPHRIRIEATFLGYTDLGVVLDRMEGVLAGPACSPSSSSDCEIALREAAVATVAEIAPTAEHRIRALQEGTELALQALDELLGRRRHDITEIFRIVRRPWIGFSVGGLLTEEAADRLEFEVEDGAVVADGVEGDGFKTLVLLDLYLRPVDLAVGSPGFAPHLSVGFTVGDVLQPGAFAATTLPFTGGRLSPFGGVLLRRETEDASAEDEPALDVDRRLRWVAGVKVGLPVAP